MQPHRDLPGGLAREELRQKLCKVFCSYYKPDKKEDLTCLGYDVIRWLLDKGVQIDFTPWEKPAGPARRDTVDTHGQARGTLTECKLRLTGFADRPSLRSGTHSPTGNPVEPCGRLDDVVDEILIQHLCQHCPFYKDDCDYAARHEKSYPCGGYILMQQLLDQGTISIDDIRIMN